MSTLKDFLKYVSLNVLGMIGLSCYILADTFFISKALGANGLAALNLSISIFSFINAAGLMLGIGGATKYSILKTRNRQQGANGVFSGVVVIGIISGLLSLLIGALFSSNLAEFLGADSTTLPLAAVYLKIALCFSPCFILNNILLAFVRNDGSPQLSMAAMIIGSLSNIILDYILIFPLEMGMSGAAIATGFAPIISIGILSLHFLKEKNQLRFVGYKINSKQTFSIMSLGISSFITEISSGIALVIFNLQILRLTGNIGVAAYGIIANISLVCISIFTGIAQGIQPITSQAYGKGDSTVLRQLRKYSFTLALALAVLIYLFSNLFSNGIISVFNKEGNVELINIATNGIRIYFAGFFFAGINIVIAGFLSASSQAKAGFLISITRGCLAILLFALTLPYFLGMNGVWLSFVFSEMVASILVLRYQLQEKRAKAPGLVNLME